MSRGSFPRRMIRKALQHYGYSIVNTYKVGGFPWDFQYTDVIRSVQQITMAPVESTEVLCRAVEYIIKNKIPGDICECGVWRGGQMAAAGMVCDKLGDCRTIWLFDTFDGLLQPTEEDIDMRGIFASTKTKLMSDSTRASKEEVQTNMAFYQGGKVYVEGDVCQTLKQFALPKKIALLRLDMDYYIPTKAALTHLYARLVRGGILLVDDMGVWAGARQAVNEYFQEKVFFTRYDRLGAVLYVKP